MGLAVTRQGGAQMLANIPKSKNRPNTVSPRPQKTVLSQFSYRTRFKARDDEKPRVGLAFYRHKYQKRSQLAIYDFQSWRGVAKPRIGLA